MTNHDGEFSGLSEDNRRIWDGNAIWWDDRIGDGNEFQALLIEPATERLLRPRTGDTILDIACGAGRSARRMAASRCRRTCHRQRERRKGSSANPSRSGASIGR